MSVLLPHPFGTEDRDDLAARQIEVETVVNGVALEPLDETADRDVRTGRGARSVAAVGSKAICIRFRSYQANGFRVLEERRHKPTSAFVSMIALTSMRDFRTPSEVNTFTRA